MKKLCLVLLLIPLLTACATIPAPTSASQGITQNEERSMELGNFSVSLAVKDIAESRAFYEKLGFTIKGGDQQQNWLVMRNGTTIIGLFQGMFERNILTFNPGWDNDANQLPEFTDVRDLQRKVKAQGIDLLTEADEASNGPASFVIEDPDGNQILIDQHVPASD